MAAATDLSFNPRGYAAVLCNDLLTSLYLIMVKNTPASNGLRCASRQQKSPTRTVGRGEAAVGRVQADWQPRRDDNSPLAHPLSSLPLPLPAPPGCSTTGMLFYNASLSLPMLLLAVALKGEAAAMGTYPLLFNSQVGLGACQALAGGRGGGQQEWQRVRGRAAARVPLPVASAAGASGRALRRPFAASPPSPGSPARSSSWCCCSPRRWASPSTTPPLCAPASTSRS